MNGKEHAAAVVAHGVEERQQRLLRRVDDAGSLEVAGVATGKRCRPHADDGDPGAAQRANGCKRARMVVDAQNEGSHRTATGHNTVRGAGHVSHPHRIEDADVPVREVEKWAARERPIVVGKTVSKPLYQDAWETASRLLRVHGHEALPGERPQFLFGQNCAPGNELGESSPIDRGADELLANGVIYRLEVGDVNAVEGAEIARPSAKHQIAVEAPLSAIDEAELAQGVVEAPREIRAIPHLPDASVVSQALDQLRHRVEPGHSLNSDRKRRRASLPHY